MPEATEDPTKRRHLVAVARLNLDSEPDLVHLSVLKWWPMVEAWATGMTLCGRSASQGALPADTAATCQDCEGLRDSYERALEGRPTVEQERLAAAEAAVERVRTIHNRAECSNARCKLGGWCIGCAPEGADGGCSGAPWPCPTVLALEPNAKLPDQYAAWVLRRDHDKVVAQLAALESGSAFPLPIRPDGTHHYVSTYCLHSDHAACRLTCLCCGQPCQCDCGHPKPEPECPYSYHDEHDEGVDFPCVCEPHAVGGAHGCPEGCPTHNHGGEDVPESAIGGRATDEELGEEDRCPVCGCVVGPDCEACERDCRHATTDNLEP